MEKEEEGNGQERDWQDTVEEEEVNLEEQSGMKGGMEAKSNRCFFTMGIQAHA